MQKQFVSALIVLFSLCPLCLCGEPSPLFAKLDPLAQKHQGKVAIAVKHLGTGEEFRLSDEEVMSTASLIKFPVMVETYYQFAEGKVKPGDMVTLQKDDKVPGSGILTNNFSPGATFPLVDAVHLMIVYSDNTATNLVLDQIGLRSTNTRMEALGLPHTKIYAKVFKRSTSSIDLKSSEKYGLGSTSPREMIVLLEKMHKGELVSRQACDAMLDHMKKCDDKTKFSKFLPPGTVIAQKTGSVDDAKTAAGIIYVPVPGTDPKKKETQPIALCVMTNENKDKRWTDDNAGDNLCAKVARAVYDHYAAAKTQSATDEHR